MDKLWTVAKSRVFDALTLPMGNGISPPDSVKPEFVYEVVSYQLDTSELSSMHSVGVELNAIKKSWTLFHSCTGIGLL